MFCSYCGAKIPVDSKFCYKCGKEVNNKVDGVNDTAIEEISADIHSKNNENIPAVPENNLRIVVMPLFGMFNIGLSLSLVYTSISAGASGFEVLAVSFFIAGVIALVTQRRDTRKMWRGGVCAISLVHAIGPLITLNLPNAVGSGWLATSVIFGLVFIADYNTMEK